MIFLQELSKDLSSNPHQLLAKVILIQSLGFFLIKKKKSSIIRASWINLHLLHFMIIKKISNEQIFNKNFQNFNGKISKNKSSRKNLHEQIFKRKNLQNHIPKEKSPWTNLLKNFQKFNGKISKINLKGKISTNKSSKGKISKTIFQKKNLHEQIFLKILKIQWKNLHNKSSRKNLYEQIFKRKNLHKSSLKIFKSSKEKSPKLFFKEKSLMNKSSIKFFKIAMEKSPEWIFKEKSPYFKGKISMNKSSLKFFECSKDKYSRKKNLNFSRKNLQWINLHKKNLQWKNLH